ncbi:MAG: acyl-CoA thioesterase/bile acid-CoA:amino acid N-acyltransferase family protein [Pseudomonadota bacterium]
MSFQLPATLPPLHADMPIIASKLPQGKVAKLKTTMIDPRGISWSAEGHYEISTNGTLNTAENASLGGTYTGVDVGGPFWSLQPPHGAAYLDGLRSDPGLSLSPAPTELEPLTYTLSLWVDGMLQDEAEIQRAQVAPGVTPTHSLPGALRGVMFSPTGAPKGAVLVLGGSEGGITPGRAAALAAEGYTALALGYFDYEDRPRAAINLPLEYFSAAIDFLKSKTGHDTVIWGGSRGSEAAMLTAIHFPDHIAGVIAWVPSHLVNQGFDMAAGEDFSKSSAAMWAVKGEPIDGAPSTPVTESIKARRKTGYAAPPGYAYTPEFQKGWGDAGHNGRFAIKVEDLKAPLCIISAADDALWPSALGGRYLFERRSAAGLLDQTRHICLPHSGHAIGMPNMPRPFSHISYWSGGYSGVEGGFIAQGGAPATNAAAARDGWAAALDFLGDVF